MEFRNLFVIRSFFIFEIMSILLFFKMIFILFTYTTPPLWSNSKLDNIVFHHYLLLFNWFSIRGYWFVYFNISLFYYCKQAVMQHIAAREVPTYFEVRMWHSALSPNTDYYIFVLILWFYSMAVYYNNCIWFWFWLLNFQTSLMNIFNFIFFI